MAGGVGADVLWPPGPRRSWGFVKLKVSPLLGHQPSFSREEGEGIPPDPTLPLCFAKWVDLPLPLLEAVFRLVAAGPEDWAHRQVRGDRPTNVPVAPLHLCNAMGCWQPRQFA